MIKILSRNIRGLIIILMITMNDDNSNDLLRYLTLFSSAGQSFFLPFPPPAT